MATQQLDLQPMTDGMQRRMPTPVELLSIALHNNAAIDVIERIAALVRQERAFQAELEFNDALNLAQKECGRIVPNADNPSTHSKYATYSRLDGALRPIYLKHGFSLSFDTDPSIPPEVEMVRVRCYLSRGGHTRVYHYDMPADGKGAKGSDVMTKTHARGSAGSYGMRYLLKMIFNVAIGEDDNDGNLSNGTFAELNERLEWIENCSTLAELKKIYDDAYAAAKATGDGQAMLRIVRAKDTKKAELRKAGED